MNQHLKAVLVVLPLWVILGVGVYLAIWHVPSYADTPVEFSDINLVNDPFSHFQAAVFQGSVVTNDDLSVVVGESPWLNEWDMFLISYQVSVAIDQWAILSDTDYYRYRDLYYDRLGHRDTLTGDLIGADFASGTSVAPCEWVVYCIDFAGM